MEGAYFVAFLDKISNITKNAVDKTGDMIEINSLKAKINTEESRISTIKARLGEYYWKRFNEGAELEEEAAKFCGDIKEALDIIDGYNKEIENIKGEPVKVQNEILTCSSCGAELAEGVKFCGECGAKIE